MSQKPLLTVNYWAYPLQDGRMEDLEGIDDFESELAQKFNIYVSGKPSDALGGGLYELVINIFHNESVQHALSFGSGLLADSVTDLVKDRIKEILTNNIAEPIKNAFSNLNAKNKDKNPEISKIKIKFKDIDIIIYNITSDGIARNIDIVLDILSARINKFIVKDQMLPSYIYIPLFKDNEAKSKDWKQLPVFRTLRDVDETIKGVTDNAYLDYWGLFYTFQEDQCRIYNVRTHEITNADFDFDLFSSES